MQNKTYTFSLYIQYIMHAATHDTFMTPEYLFTIAAHENCLKHLQVLSILCYHKKYTFFSLYFTSMCVCVDVFSSSIHCNNSRNANKKKRERIQMNVNGIDKKKISDEIEHRMSQTFPSFDTYRFLYRYYRGTIQGKSRTTAKKYFSRSSSSAREK